MTNADRDATYGKDRIARATFIREEMRRTRCLASEASARYRTGCPGCKWCAPTAFSDPETDCYDGSLNEGG